MMGLSYILEFTAIVIALLIYSYIQLWLFFPLYRLVNFFLNLETSAKLKFLQRLKT